jgi:hypothetical protein
MLVKGVIDVVILVEGEVGAYTGLVSPRVDSITDKVHDSLVGLVRVPIQQDGK